jgi:hypothetical protein
VSGKATFLLILVNAFVGFIFFRSYQQGMPIGRVLLFGLISLVAMNAAAILGHKLGEARSRQLAARRERRR